MTATVSVRWFGHVMSINTQWPASKQDVNRSRVTPIHVKFLWEVHDWLTVGPQTSCSVTATSELTADRQRQHSSPRVQPCSRKDGNDGQKLTSRCHTAHRGGTYEQRYEKMQERHKITCFYFWSVVGVRSDVNATKINPNEVSGSFKVAPTQCAVTDEKKTNN